MSWKKVYAMATMVIDGLFSLGFGFQDGFSLTHTTFVVFSGVFRMFQDVSGWAVNNHDWLRVP
jgi:hypothetical protein